MVEVGEGEETMALQPQAALEQAVANALLASGQPNGSGYPESMCGRMFDGEPPARCGNIYVSVWYDGQRGSDMRTCLDEHFGVYVTLSIRFTQPWDRIIIHRDDMECRANRIRALIHSDSLDFNISRAAGVLAGFDGAGQAVGFREALSFGGFDGIQPVGPDWFHAHPDSQVAQVGIAQRIRFGKSRRVQALATMS